MVLGISPESLHGHVDKDAIAELSRAAFKRKGDEVPEPAGGHSILVWE
jgi:hypothetical protein